MAEARSEALYPWKGGNAHFQGGSLEREGSQGLGEGKSGAGIPPEGKFPPERDLQTDP